MLKVNSKTRVAVCGASGFIGCHLVAFLKEKGYWVRGIDVREKPFREKMYGVADEMYICDLRDADDAEWALEGVKYVFHLASDMGGVGYFHTHNYEPFINNMTMDMNILRACEKLKIKRLFYSSSACVYPVHLSSNEGKPTMLHEDMIIPANSDQMYGWEKLMMLKLCEEAPFDARVGIFDTIYGPYQEFEGERVKFPCAIAKKALDARKTGKIDIWGNGKQLRVFNYIDDALEQIYRIMFDKKYDGPVNVCSNRLVSIQECADVCCKIIGIKPKFSYNLKKPSGVLSRQSSDDEYIRRYQYRSVIDPEEGFRRLIEWLKELV